MKLTGRSGRDDPIIFFTFLSKINMKGIIVRAYSGLSLDAEVVEFQTLLPGSSSQLASLHSSCLCSSSHRDKSG